MKVATEQIETWELDSLLDALLDGSLELNKEFISKYCGENVATQLLRLPDEQARRYCLDGTLEDGMFPGFVIGDQPDAIYLPHGEIEHQFEGSPEDCFEIPDDFTIKGNLAYLYTGYGALFPCDIAALQQNVDDYLS